MDERWLSVDEIAEYLGVNRETIYKWISRKKLPGHKAGKLWKFRTTEVDEWVRQGKATERASAGRGTRAKSKDGGATK